MNVHIDARCAPLWAAMGSALLGAVAHAQISGYYDDKFHFRYEVSGLGDFDQVRQQNDDMDTLGLPGDGSMYCAPAAAMNILAFIADNGYPQIMPGQDDWASYTEDGGWFLNEKERYNFITERIMDLGSPGYMNTDEDTGTDVEDLRDGLIDWLAFYENTWLSQFDVDQWGAPGRDWMEQGGTSPKPWEIAQYGLDGAVIVMLYGRYAWEADSPQDVTLTARTGGHYVAVQLAESIPTSVNHTIMYRNSSTDTNDSKLRQDTYRITTRRAELWDLDTPISGNHLRTILFQSGQDSLDDIDPDKMPVIDNVMVVRAKYGFTQAPDGGTITMTLPGFDPDGQMRLDTFPPPASRVLYGRLSPDKLRQAVLTEPQPPLAGALYLIDTYGGATTQVADMTDPKRLVFSRQRLLYVLDGDQLIQYDVFDAPVELARIVLPSPFPGAAMDYDDDADELVVLSEVGLVLLRYAQDLAGDPMIEPIPAAVALGGGVHMAIDPTDGAVWISSTGADAVTRLVRDATGAWMINFVQTGLGIQSISLDDRGHLFAPVNDHVAEFMVDPGGGGLVTVNTSPFVGQRCGSWFQISRSRTSLHPDLSSSPGSGNIPADQVDTGGENPPPCVPDLNGDGQATSQDFIVFLNAFVSGDPIADANEDGVINSQDFIEFLNAFVAGC